MGESQEALAAVEAARDGDVAALRAALAAGGDVHARDENDWSALDWAAGRGEPAAVRALLEAGADPTAAGHEARTPYEIALAAGHLDAARELREAEAAVRGESGETGRGWDPYCRAYPLAQLAAFPQWPGGTDPADAAGEGGILYLHHDLTVTRSIWHGEDVVLAEPTPEWERFCRVELGFTVPDDFELM